MGSVGGLRLGVEGTRAAVFSEWPATAEMMRIAPGGGGRLPCRGVSGLSAGRGCWQWTAMPPLSLPPGSKQSSSVSVCQEGSRQSIGSRWRESTYRQQSSVEGHDALYKRRMRGVT